MLQDALEIKTRVLEPGDSATLNSMENLENVFERQTKADEVARANLAIAPLNQPKLAKVTRTVQRMHVTIHAPRDQNRRSACSARSESHVECNQESDFSQRRQDYWLSCSALAVADTFT